MPYTQGEHRQQTSADRVVTVWAVVAIWLALGALWVMLWSTTHLATNTPLEYDPATEIVTLSTTTIVAVVWSRLVL